MRHSLTRPAAIVCAAVAFFVALIAFFPLGGYRLLPTKYENCFTPNTPCRRLGGEQRD